MHTFTYGMPPKRLPTSTNHQNAYQLQIRLPAYHMLTCLPAYHISRGHKRLPAYLLTTCPVATDHSNAEKWVLKGAKNKMPFISQKFRAKISALLLSVATGHVVIR